MLNRIDIMGRLTRDPELRYTPSGKPVVSFAIAVDRDYAPKGGEKETDFIDIVAWQSTAEFVHKYFSKGRMIIVSGQLQIRKWDDKDGVKRKSPEIIAERVYFGDSNPDSNKNSHSQDLNDSTQTASSSPPPPTQQYAASPDIYDYSQLSSSDDDLPF